MKVCGSCGAWIPDDATVCPNCARATGGAPAPPPSGAPGPAPAPDPSGVPPAGGSPGAPGSPDPGAAAAFRRRAEERVRALGALYMVAGFLTLGMVALSFLRAASGAHAQSLEDLQKLPGPSNPELVRLWEGVIRWWADFVLQPWYLAVTHAMPFLLGVFWVWSGSRLRALEGRGPALLGAALLLLPCTGCCCLFIPLGIYALVTLTRGDSEMVLQARRRGGR